MTRVVLDPLPALLRRAVKVVSLEENSDDQPSLPAYVQLVRTGVLHRIATGYYALVPSEHFGRQWLPSLEAAAWGIAAADDGPRSVSLMGISAARQHGALDDEPPMAVIATTRNRPPVRFADRPATVSFVRRDPARLRIKRHSTQLGQGWITTVEQTMLDLAAYPQLGGRPDLAKAAIGGLVDQADPHLLYSLATAQQRHGALDRILQQL